MKGEPPRPPDWAGIFLAFQERGARFVVIGGVGAILHGVPIVSQDVDIVPDPAADNLTRISKALVAQRASAVGVGPVIDLSDGEWLRASRFWNFDTNNGRVDILFAPAGVEGYGELQSAAATTDLGDGLNVRVASVEHLIAMKEAAGRAKDQFALPTLRWLLERHRHSQPDQ